MTQPTGRQRLMPHIEGGTFLSYSPEGNSLVTGGGEGLVKIHKNLMDRIEEPRFLDHDFAAITSLQHTNQHIYVGSEDGTISQINAITMDFEKFFYRTSLPIRQLLLNPDHSQLIILSDDLTVKVISTLDTSNITTLDVGKKSVVSLAVAAKGNKIIGLDADGNLLSWQLEAKDGTSKVSAFKSYPKLGRSGVKIDSGDVCQIDCNIQGTQIAVPNDNSEVQVFDTSNFNPLTTLQKELRPISFVKFSPNGQYLAVATKTPDLKVYNCDNWKLVKEIQLEYEIIDMSWNPTNNQLSFTDWEGGLSLIDDVIDSDGGLISPFAKITTDEEEPIKSQGTQMEVDDDDVNDDDLDNISIDDDGISLNSEVGRSPSPQPQDFPHQVRPGFVPGSFISTLTNQTMLNFNTTGYIRLSNVEPSTISVNYFESQFNQNLNITNHYNYDMGYISNYGVLLARNSSNDDPASIYFQTTTLQGDQMKWNLQLENQVEIAGLCLTNIGPLIITDDCRLHWFSKGGVELVVQASHHQNFVSCCADATGRVFLLYADGHQYKFVILDASSHERIQTIVPLSDLAIPSSDQIDWIGFTDEAIPMIFTTDGSFLVFSFDSAKNSGFWYPVLDIPHNKKNPFHYPIGGNVGQIYLVSIDRQDRWLTAPIVTNETWSIPLVLSNKEKEANSFESELTEKRVVIDLLRGLGALSTDQEALLLETCLDRDKTIIKYLYFCAKHSLDTRAFELCKMLTKIEDVQNVIRLVRTLNKVNLVQKLEEYLEHLELEQINGNGKRVGDSLFNGIPKHSR